MRVRGVPISADRAFYNHIFESGSSSTLVGFMAQLRSVACVLGRGSTRTEIRHRVLRPIVLEEPR